MAYDVKQLLKKTDAELDAIFGKSQPGPIPNGKAKGTAIVANGTKFSPAIASAINLFGWQGKTFDAKRGTLRNRITAFGFDAIVAQVYVGNSLYDDKPCIVIDYTQTSTIAQRVRDEIRLIAPKTYLGRVYWSNKAAIHFALQTSG